MTTANKIELGKGIYNSSDISVIMKLPSEKVRRWLNMYLKENLIETYNNTSEINFQGLIEFYFIFQLYEHGLKSRKIKLAREQISKVLKTDYPFSHADILAIDYSSIYFRDGDNIINADSSLQFNMKELIEPFCKKIEYSENRTAQRFFPCGKESSIVVDPRIKFGAPIIDGTGITAETIYMFHRGGEETEHIAWMFNIKETLVNEAIEFYKQAA